jgi:hypothetical protein
MCEVTFPSFHGLQATSTRLAEAEAQVIAAERQCEDAVQAAKQWCCSETLDRALKSMRTIKDQDVQLRSLREKHATLKQKLLEVEAELNKLQRITDTRGLQDKVSVLEMDVIPCQEREQAAQVCPVMLQSALHTACSMCVAARNSTHNCSEWQENKWEENKGNSSCWTPTFATSTSLQFTRG